MNKGRACTTRAANLVEDHILTFSALFASSSGASCALAGEPCFCKRSSRWLANAATVRCEKTATTDGFTPNLRRRAPTSLPAKMEEPPTWKKSASTERSSDLRSCRQTCSTSFSRSFRGFTMGGAIFEGGTCTRECGIFEVSLAPIGGAVVSKCLSPSGVWSSSIASSSLFARFARKTLPVLPFTRALEKTMAWGHLAGWRTEEQKSCMSAT
mmetsp:Transcript_2749/g.8070  ORF Transcript_2749/g.8070 Transcript_2749/m.8070 type:complete len:212 (+) Transcript_2749:2465-3100(+)